MKKNIIYSWLALLFVVTACYEPLEINTENIDKLDMPIKIAAPLVDGQLVIDYDSLINLDDIDNGFITFENNKAYIKFDTVFDFYDQLSVFLGAADIDFGDATQFQQSFDMDVEPTPTTIQVVYWKNGIAFHGEDVPISPQDSFRTKYNYNSIFLGIDQDAEMRIDGYDMDKEMNLGLDFEIYKVELQSGKIEFSLSAENFPIIADDSLRIHPSFHYTDNGEDTIIMNEKAFNIENTSHTLPLGLEIKLNMAIGNLYTAEGDTFKHEFTISSFDTTLSVDLAGMYYEGNGDNKIDVKILNWMEVDADAQKVIVPLPEKMNIEAGISDLKFQQVQFNYGRDSMFSNEFDFDFDIFEMLPDEIEERFADDIDVNGFYIKDPIIKLKLRSNLGFSAKLGLDNMQFRTSGSPELITNDGTASLSIQQPENPNSIMTPILALEDSMVIDSTTSRISQIDLYNLKGVHIDYVVVLNPEDKGHLPEQHNFIYLYDEEDREQMYDVKFAASALVPIAFRFNNITVESTQELSLDSLDTDILSLNEEDSINLNVKLWTTNFPFDMVSQFYFGKTDQNGNLEILDSLFNNPELIIPASNEGIQDSTSWRVTLDNDRFDAIQTMDSVKLKIRFAMDDESYYHIEKGSSLAVGYKFSIAPSSATIDME